MGSPFLWETEANDWTFQKDCGFVHFSEAPCTIHVPLQGHILLYLLFLISVMKWGSPVFLSPFLNQKAKQGEKEKKFTMWLLRSAEGLLRTLQRTVAPNSCWLQYILKYLPFKKNLALSTYNLHCNWWELQNLSTTENQTISHAHWLPLMEATICLGEFWELYLKFQHLNEEMFLFISLLLVLSPSENRAGAVLWDQVPQGHLEALSQSLNPHVPSPPSCDGVGSLDKWALFIMHW